MYNFSTENDIFGNDLYYVIYGGRYDPYTNEISPYFPEKTELYFYSPFRTDLTPHEDDKNSFGNEKQRWDKLYLNKIDIINDQINSNIIHKITINVNDEENPDNNGEFVINGDTYPFYHIKYNLGFPNNKFKTINTHELNLDLLNIDTSFRNYFSEYSYDYSNNLKHIKSIQYSFEFDESKKKYTGLNPNYLKIYFPDLVFEQDNKTYIDYIGVVSHIVNLIGYYDETISNLHLLQPETKQSESSDGRLKQNINNIEYGLNDILKLNPISFNWKNKDTNDLNFGLIAQDVKNVFPELVITDLNNHYRIKYIELIPILIKSIKDQQETIQKLNKRIDCIESKVNNIMQGNI